jgi:glutathione S-transferase
MSSTPDNQFQNRPDFVAAHEFMSLKGAQREAAYRAVNPMMALPALIDGDGPILFESLAIIEYLDETHPAAAAARRPGPRACAGARTNRRLRFTPADRAARARISGTRIQAR